MKKQYRTKQKIVQKMYGNKILNIKTYKIKKTLCDMDKWLGDVIKCVNDLDEKKDKCKNRGC